MFKHCPTLFVFKSVNQLNDDEYEYAKTSIGEPPDTLVMDDKQRLHHTIDIMQRNKKDQHNPFKKAQVYDLDGFRLNLRSQGAAAKNDYEVKLKEQRDIIKYQTQCIRSINETYIDENGELDLSMMTDIDGLEIYKCESQIKLSRKSYKDYTTKLVQFKLAQDQIDATQLHAKHNVYFEGVRELLSLDGDYDSSMNTWDKLVDHYEDSKEREIELSETFQDVGEEVVDKTRIYSIAKRYAPKLKIKKPIPLDIVAAPTHTPFDSNKQQVSVPTKTKTRKPNQLVE